MSGHTNRNKRNGGNPRSRRGPPRQRGAEGRPDARPDGRAGSQPKNELSPGAEPDTQPDTQPDTRDSERRPGRDFKRPFRAPPPPAQSIPPTDESGSGQAQADESGASPDELAPPPERQGFTRPRGRSPFAAASHGGHAYIPASGPRPGMNGSHGQNGHESANGANGANGSHGQNGHMSTYSAMGMGTSVSASAASDDSSYETGNETGNETEAIPQTWRTERLNGGADTTPREPFRPESRGDVGSLVDALHELFAQDRSVASQGDGTRCGICYLHFPLNTLEYREAEGFYICAGCQRALGRQQVMMVRRQQASHGG